jgi:heme/copper-type cytochrome/quinol oxidase subunit 2
MTAQPPQPPPPSGYPPPQQPPAGQAPNNYLVWSILVTLFCCLIPGIVAIVFSAQVNGLWAQGRYDESQKMSDRAKTWVIISAVLGIIVIVIYVILFATGAFNTPTPSPNPAMPAAVF